ncbi:MAG: ParB/RepB/Spo0J family partition protein [Clostridia bacterium]|nr:ParB/RepB/Spo0J family partition protein [Clostridia bacterium]
MTLTLQKKSELLHLSPSQISPSPHQPRRLFPEGELTALAESIREHGVLQPLVVTPCEDGYLLVAGERRLRAAKLAGVSAVPCILYERPTEDCAIATMTENLQRQNLSYWEEAYGYKALLDQFGYTQEQLAAKIGKSQSAVANKLRLLKLPIPIQSKLAAHNLTERHARALLQLGNTEQLYRALEVILARRYTVAQTEQYVARLVAPKPQRRKPTAVVRDRRICKNTIDRAIKLINQAGIKAVSQTSETDAFIQYIIRIPKR